MKKTIQLLKISSILTLVLTFVLCFVYPLIVFTIGQILFHKQANGSLIKNDKTIVGSALIAQNFQTAKYFHPRPSAAGKNGYDGANSSGSNLGPTSQKLIDTVKGYIQKYRSENSLSSDTPLPPDAVTASASGLDPDISLENALLQVPRVASARNLSEDQLKKLIYELRHWPTLGLIGESRLNVLLINIKLDELSSK